MFDYKTKICLENKKDISRTASKHPNLKCHDNWDVGKLVIGGVVVAHGGVAKVSGYEILDAEDVTDGGDIARFFCACGVTTVNPFFIVSHVFIRGQHYRLRGNYFSDYQIQVVELARVLTDRKGGSAFLRHNSHIKK